MGKASELDARAKTLSQEEIDERKGNHRPALQLRQDVLSQALAPTARVEDVLKHLGGETLDHVALHDPTSGVTAVAVPLERYLQLIGADVADRDQLEVGLDGRMLPSDATLAASGVEQVDRQAPWSQIPHDLA